MVEMWVQIHNLPLMCMNRRAAKLIADQIGTAIEIPADSKECRGRFLRVKVQIDISKPLKRFIKLSVEDSGKPVVAPLTYERLPEFCYACVRIGHGLRECPDDEARTKALEGSSTRFGSWMRAAVGERTKGNQQRQWGKNSSDSSENKSLSLSDGTFKKAEGNKLDPYQSRALERSSDGEIAGRMTDRMGAVTRPGKELIESGYEELTSLAGHRQGFDSLSGEKHHQEKGEAKQVENSASISAMEGVVIYSGNFDTGEIKETNTIDEIDEIPKKKNVKKWKRIARSIRSPPPSAKVLSPLHRILSSGLKSRKSPKKGTSSHDQKSPKSKRNLSSSLEPSPTFSGGQDNTLTMGSPGLTTVGVAVGDAKRKEMCGGADEERELKKKKSEQVTDSTILSAEPVEQARREP